MKRETVHLANEIMAKIENVKTFLLFTEDMEKCSLYDRLVLKVKKSVSFSLFGSHYYHVGTNEKEINIPVALVDIIREDVFEYKKQLEKELEELQ